jgi:(1->4)-alpha-D-glucan 1-alpha-D-glucosylmutase
VERLQEFQVTVAQGNLVNKIYKAINEAVSLNKRWPVSVYRLQFSKNFTFRRAAGLVPYLYELGITDCYASPYFKARAGSLHGYDVADQNMINPEVGSEKDYQDFVHRLREYGMGQVLDIVPNHMAIFDNPKWQDVLENGPDSIYAGFFDIHWEPVKNELHHKVLLPILEAPYGIVLEKGLITLGFMQGAFTINYREHHLPVNLKTTTVILEPCLDLLQGRLRKTHRDYLELRAIIAACRNLPVRGAADPGRVTARHRKKENIKKRLTELCARNRIINSAIEEHTKSLNGTAGNSASFTKLHELLEKQNYRLSFWRVATEEINYRRFFDVNELIALRMEDPVVFEENHRLVRELVNKGILTGLRIDHIDGLFNPADYLWRLQEVIWLDMALTKIKQDRQIPRSEKNRLNKAIQDKYERDFDNRPDAGGLRPLYLVVEKILGEKETLREGWPVDGTTGYEFATALNQIFINKKHSRPLMDIYRGFTSSSDSYEDIAYKSKKLVMQTSMAAEVNFLADQLDRLSEKSWRHRDFTLNSIKQAVLEVIACFPVYRTYIDAYRGIIDKRDRATIDTAIMDAGRRNPASSTSIFDFIRNTLLLNYPADMDETGREEQRLFTMRFQQYTGPVMAKGVEDTALYLYNPLISLNEVGGNPQNFGSTLDEFHRQNMRRCKSKPHSFITTSTHDSKRGEDVRARIDVISEIPQIWKSTLTHWHRLNKNKKITGNGCSIPDSSEEYLIYQTLLGTYPVDNIDRAGYTKYVRRIQNYMLKALREAKVHTNWIEPDTGYENAVIKFVAKILEPSPSNQFLADFKTLNSLVASCGMYNSLSQVVIKAFSPGVPDIYQGNEVFAFNLTDPDNRVPVDFERCNNLLNDLKKDMAHNKEPARLAQALSSDTDKDRLKLYIMWRSLNYRRDNPMLFTEGEYIPLHAEGTKKNNLCAFAWQKDEQRLIVVVPRLVAGLTGKTGKAPTGVEVWGNTHLILPDKPGGSRYSNIFTGEHLNTSGDKEPALLLTDVLNNFPVAVLTRKNSSIVSGN